MVLTGSPLLALIFTAGGAWLPVVFVKFKAGARLKLFDNQLAEYDPYATPDFHGSADKAKSVMMGSKYDTKHNGLCDASVCKNVLMLADTRAVDSKMIPIIQQDAKKIGITFDVRTINGAHIIMCRQGLTPRAYSSMRCSSNSAARLPILSNG